MRQNRARAPGATPAAPAPSSAPRVRRKPVIRRPWLLLVLPVLSLPACWAWFGATSPAVEAAQPGLGQTATQPGWIGVNSCAAAACHGSAGADTSVRGEYTMWASRDPHVKAYQALFKPESKRMAKT